MRSLQAWFHCYKDRRSESVVDVQVEKIYNVYVMKAALYQINKQIKLQTDRKCEFIIFSTTEQEKLTKRDFPSGSFFSE